jgi:hypothetical protein
MIYVTNHWDRRLVLLGHKMWRINDIEAIDLKTRILLSEMAPHSGRSQSVDEIYALLRTAGARKAAGCGHVRRVPSTVLSALVGQE